MKKSETRIKKAEITLLKRNPFYGRLLLNSEASITEIPSIKTAATDGKRVFFNEDFVKSLQDDELVGVLAHELSHAALLHLFRSKDLEDKERANVAADIIVNSLVIEMGLNLPSCAILKEEWAHMSLHEIYNLLDDETMQDLSGAGQGMSEDLCVGNPDLGGSDSSENVPQEGGETTSDISERELTKSWKDALSSAATEHKMAGNQVGNRLLQIIDSVHKSKVNWKSILLQYLTRIPYDYEGFDRRFLHNRQYIDDLGGGKVKLEVYIDTSGSCVNALEEMMPEVSAMVNSYPHVEGKLYYFDTCTYGPFALEKWKESHPQGGGGTMWEPIGEELTDSYDTLVNATMSKSLVVIITDGYIYDLNEKSKRRENTDYLWVIVEGGVGKHSIPFGEVIRLGG